MMMLSGWITAYQAQTQHPKEQKAPDLEPQCEVILNISWWQFNLRTTKAQNNETQKYLKLQRDTNLLKTGCVSSL